MDEGRAAFTEAEREGLVAIGQQVAVALEERPWRIGHEGEYTEPYHRPR